MKKLVLALVALGLLVTISVFLTRDKNNSSGIVEGEWDQAETTPSKTASRDEKRPVPEPGVVNSAKVEPVNPFMPGQKLDPASLSEQEIEELEEYFDKVEEGWGKKMEELFLKELSLGEKGLEEYGQLRENYEEEKMIAYQEFHEFMVGKYGENYAYNPTEEMEVFENKVHDIYLEKLRKQLGDENYARYLEIKDQYNDQLRREQDPEKGVVLIEL